MADETVDELLDYFRELARHCEPWSEQDVDRIKAALEREREEVNKGIEAAARIMLHEGNAALLKIAGRVKHLARLGQGTAWEELEQVEAEIRRIAEGK